MLSFAPAVGAWLGGTGRRTRLRERTKTRNGFPHFRVSSRPLNNLECISKVANVPLVLHRPNWYGRVTATEAVTHAPASNRRRPVEADRTAAPEAAATPVEDHGPTARSRSGRVDRHPVRLAEWAAV